MTTQQHAAEAASESILQPYLLRQVENQLAVEQFVESAKNYMRGANMMAMSCAARLSINLPADRDIAAMMHFLDDLENWLDQQGSFLQRVLSAPVETPVPAEFTEAQR